LGRKPEWPGARPGIPVTLRRTYAFELTKCPRHVFVIAGIFEIDGVRAASGLLRRGFNASRNAAAADFSRT